MRRGGHGFKFQAPWRRHDDPTQSPSALEQVEGLGFRRLVALAAMTIAISVVMLQWRRHEPTKRDLRASKPGFLFPLYGYSYRQFRNASTDSEGTLWRGRRGAAHHRALQQLDDDDDNSGPFFKLRQGFYITMKLGLPPKKFNFLIDTGSRSTWVYCKIPGHASSIRMTGPNGMYEAKRGSTMKCLGNTADLCDELQDQNQDKCTSNNKYECALFIQYADLTTIVGVFVTDSMTLPLQDKSEVDVHAFFGCGTERHDGPSSVPVVTDGLIGLGNCKSTLPYQWFEKNLISQNVVSFCIAKTMEPVIKRAKIGYVAVGMDFNEKFEEGSLTYTAWAPLVLRHNYAHCAYTINLLFISFLGNTFKPQAHGVPMLVDTGSERTYLEGGRFDSNSSQKLREQLALYANDRGYVEVGDDPKTITSEHRLCWEPPSKSMQTEKGKQDISPMNDFPLMRFFIEGEMDDSGDDVILDLNVQPDGYLEWEADEKRLCVNINKEDDPIPVQNFGAHSLKEHLFVLDFENQRVRWHQDTCELP